MKERNEAFRAGVTNQDSVMTRSASLDLAGSAPAPQADATPSLTGPRHAVKPLSYYANRYGMELGIFIHARKKQGKRAPWTVAYKNMRQRCNGKDPQAQYYAGRGIKCRMSFLDVRESYIAARAWRLRQASVDRVDPNGDYTLTNIRWIEFDENRAKANAAKSIAARNQ